MKLEVELTLTEMTQAYRELASLCNTKGSRKIREALAREMMKTEKKKRD